jgi:hypothetical protein
MFAGADAVNLRAVVRRAFQHATMKRAAQGFGAGNLAEPWRSLLGEPSPQLKLVASTFVDLQQERHQADYDFGRPLARTEAIDLVERVEAAVAAWKAIRRTGSRPYSLEAKVFLAALLLDDSVSRR